MKKGLIVAGSMLVVVASIFYLTVPPQTYEMAQEEAKRDLEKKIEGRQDSIYQLILDDKQVSKTSMQELPRLILQKIDSSRYGKIVDIGEPFRLGCVGAADEPFSGLDFVSVGSSYSILSFTSGGIGRSSQIILYKNNGDTLLTRYSKRIKTLDEALFFIKYPKPDSALMKEHGII